MSDTTKDLVAEIGKWSIGTICAVGLILFMWLDQKNQAAFNVIQLELMKAQVQALELISKTYTGN